MNPARFISIHALREERDGWKGPRKAIFVRFQSTRSARSATRHQQPHHVRRHFNPRAPRGARPRFFRLFILGGIISIHALREERDAKANKRATTAIEFQSTRSARSATCQLNFICQFMAISIHALREERDLSVLPRLSLCIYFNPRAPRGARPLRRPSLAATWQFQSTRSARSATSPAWISNSSVVISIHALREERDPLHAAAALPI